MTREEKLQKIYEVIGPTHFGFISQDGGYTGNDIIYLMIGDVLDRIQLVGYTHRSSGDVEILFNFVCKRREKKREPIDNQSDDFIDVVVGLL